VWAYWAVRLGRLMGAPQTARCSHSVVATPGVPVVDASWVNTPSEEYWLWALGAFKAFANFDPGVELAGKFGGNFDGAVPVGDPDDPDTDGRFATGIIEAVANFLVRSHHDGLGFWVEHFDPVKFCCGEEFVFEPGKECGGFFTPGGAALPLFGFFEMPG